MNRYVCGLLFNPENTFVVLIKKNKPEWQVGLLNGVGGKIEPGESPLQAIVREFKEEAGLVVPNWKHFLRVNDRVWYVDFFKAQSAEFSSVKSMTDEEVVIVGVDTFYTRKTIPNLRWIIPMCLDPNHSDGIVHTKKVFLDDNRTRYL